MGLSEHASAALRARMHEVRAAAMAQPQAPTKEELEKQKKLNELLAANVLFGNASLGGPTKPAKPYVRHIVVKDLRRVAHNMNVILPDSNLFANKSPVALFALFDGQSSANVENPGTQAAEWCCGNLHVKLLKNMSALTPVETSDMGVTAMLRKSLAELDQELLMEQLAIQDGCGASVALFIGDKLFTAVIGSCRILICSSLPVRADGSGSKASRVQTVAEGSAAASSLSVRSIDDFGTKIRSLGDRPWKAVEGTPLPITQPTCSSCRISHDNGHNVLLLTSTPIAASLPTQKAGSELVSELVTELEQRPRAISGEVAARACETTRASGEAGDTLARQFAAVTVVFLPPKGIPEELQSIAPKSASDRFIAAVPAAKKQKLDAGRALETNSLRLRHILVKHCDCPAPFDPVRQKPVTRHLSEADRLLRQALRELLKEQAARKLPADPKKAALVHMQPSPKCIALTKELSECETGKKAGIVCGDLEWMTHETMRAGFGAPFAEAAKNLVAGQWSDLLASDHGVHIVQRIA